MIWTIKLHMPQRIHMMRALRAHLYSMGKGTLAHSGHGGFAVTQLERMRVCLHDSHQVLHSQGTIRRSMLHAIPDH